MDRKPKIVITLPAYRAERTLEKTIADIPPGVREELILVDDASPDNTAEVARALGITVHVHPENRGYGGNQKTCYTMALRSGADVVVLLHPDYQYEPKAVPLLIAPILAGDADMTFGSRFAGLGDPRGSGMPMYRYLGNRVTTILQNLLMGTRFTEMHSGMRAYTRECLLALPFLRYPDNFVFDAELLIDAVSGGQRVVEVPIPTRYTKESSSIAVGPSLTYVFGGLRHAISRTLTRGRKRGRKAISVLAAADPSSESFGNWLLTTSAGYVTDGGDMKILGDAPATFRDDARSQGWTVVDGSDRADVLVVFPSSAPPGAPHSPQGAMSELSPEGLVVAVGPGPIENVTSAGVVVVGCYATSKVAARRERYSVIMARAATGPNVVLDVEETHG